MTIYVPKQWQHKGYNEKTTDKDIGLMYLNESIRFSQYFGKIIPICLPTEHLKYYNMIATVAGWGVHVSG